MQWSVLLGNKRKKNAECVIAHHNGTALWIEQYFDKLFIFFLPGARAIPIFVCAQKKNCCASTFPQKKVRARRPFFAINGYMQAIFLRIRRVSSPAPLCEMKIWPCKMVSERYRGALCESVRPAERARRNARPRFCEGVIIEAEVLLLLHFSS